MTLTEKEQTQLMDCLLDMGELLLLSGGEISRVEDTLERVGNAYGAVRMEVFVITSIISLTMELPGLPSVTQTRRICSGGGTDFTRVEEINTLSRELCSRMLPVDAFRRELDRISAEKAPFYITLLGSILAAGSFAVFFGGTIADGICAAVFGACIAFLQRHLGKTELNTVASNLLISLLIGLGVGLCTALLPFLHMDKILIGDIMLLIPGLAMTNAIRNMLVGDTISGVVRLAESLIWAAALAGGFMIALTIVRAVT